MRAPLIFPAMLVSVGVLAAGCGSSSKSGGPSKPRTLVLVNHDSGSGVITTPSMAKFVDDVEAISGGRLTVQVDSSTYDSTGTEIADVAAGRADLGWVGTRVFDTLGVPQLSPLHAPFLLDSYPLQAEVLNDPTVLDPMFAGITTLRVEPLGIMADALRFVVAARGPMLEPSDFAGARIWLLGSYVQAKAIETLGGTVLHDGDVRRMLLEGDADGQEAMWRYYTIDGGFLQAPYASMNVVLSPRTVALFANPEMFAGLDKDQQRWLREAAASSAKWAGEHAGDDDAGRMRFACQYGARIALASDDQLEALRAAAEPLYASLRTDPATGPAFARIEELRQGAIVPAPVIPDGCRYQAGEEDLAAPSIPPLAAPGATGALPAGTYRYEVYEDEVAGDEAADKVLGDSALARSLPGVITWEVGAGEWRVTSNPAAEGARPATCEGWYEVVGDVVNFTFDLTPTAEQDHCLPPTWQVGWAPQPNGDIVWGPPTVPVLAPLFTYHTWEKIG